jgi:hypothetical protein
LAIDLPGVLWDPFANEIHALPAPFDQQGIFGLRGCFNISRARRFLSGRCRSARAAYVSSRSQRITDTWCKMT